MKASVKTPEEILKKIQELKRDFVYAQEFENACKMRDLERKYLKEDEEDELEFTNEPIEIDVMKDIETDLCVSCEDDTNVPVNLSVDQRPHYVEGSGQLCITCYNKLYKK